MRLISGKIDTEKEIRTMTASQKLEFNIMCVVPFAIILYMKATFRRVPGCPLRIGGRGVRYDGLSVHICGAAYRMGRRIIRIEV